MAALAKASNYYAIDQAAINAVGNARSGRSENYPFATGATSGGNSGIIDEKSYGLFLQVDGQASRSMATTCATMSACAL